MKVIVVAAVLAAGVAVSEEFFIKGDAMRQRVEEQCAQGCLILNPQQAAQLDQYIQAAVRKAHAAGVKEGAATCKRYSI